MLAPLGSRQGCGWNPDRDSHRGRHDPFTGISTKDIEKYSDIFDVPPPENDNQARKLASDIRKWISEGRPKTKDKSKPEPKSELKIEKEEIVESKDEKPMKKRSLFGWMKK